MRGLVLGYSFSFKSQWQGKQEQGGEEEGKAVLQEHVVMVGGEGDGRGVLLWGGGILTK